MRRSLTWLVVPAVLASAAAGAQSGSQSYVVDPQSSDVHWLVYRAGAFARFGHNHVISIAAVAGEVSVDPADLARSSFTLEIPVMDLVVDDSALRKGLGEEFASEPSPDDVAGTRRNMLSERVLNAEAHPTLRVTGTGPVTRDGMQTLQMTVYLLGRAVELTVPTSVTLQGERLEASGAFELTHEQLGLEPFSVMGGALQVGNMMTFSYRIVANRAGGTPPAARP
jgi:polyisoprenoid-binding protein YceI